VIVKWVPLQPVTTQVVHVVPTCWFAGPQAIAGLHIVSLKKLINGGLHVPDGAPQSHPQFAGGALGAR
jgi:hypothetical protein